jgi:acyl-CoA thioester hydrolase
MILAINPLSEIAAVEMFRAVAYPWLCDSMGHMNTQHYCSVFDGATFHYLARFAGPRELKAMGRGWVDAKQTLEYRKEILAGDLLVVHTRMTKVGRTSLSFRHEMSDVEDGILRATSEHVVVHFDLVNRSSVALPDEIVRKAKEYLNGNANTH